MKCEVYQKVTDKIIADLQQGELTWLKPWGPGNTGGNVRPMRHNGLAYRGINILILWQAAHEARYASSIWMTYQQARELGGQVENGEKGTSVIYAGRIDRKDDDRPEDGRPEDDRSDDDRRDEESAAIDTKRLSFLKTYTVFNCDQIEGLPPRYAPELEQAADPINRIKHADRFFAAIYADIRHGGTRAYYSGSSDHVQMPDFKSFKSAEAYYATLAHELVHWTKHKTRLDRNLGSKNFGDEGYAREELVAELGAAFLCADLGLTPEPQAGHAAYIASWLKLLKQDHRAIFKAAAQAERACSFLHELQARLAILKRDEEQGLSL